MRFPASSCRLRGFTVLELTIVLAVIALLISLLLPALQHSREAARRHGCRHNLAQIGIALRAYHDSHRTLPPGVVNSVGPVKSLVHDDTVYVNLSEGNYEEDYAGDSGTDDGEEAAEAPEARYMSLTDEYNLGWLAQILPHLGQNPTYRRIDFKVPHLSFVSREAKTRWAKMDAAWRKNGGAPPGLAMPEMKPLAMLTCPSSWRTTSTDSMVITHYVGCYASQPVDIDSDNDGLLYLNSSESLEEIPDGASTTILAGEASDGAFRSYFYGDHSSLRSTGVSIDEVDLFRDYTDEPFAADVDDDPAFRSFSSTHGEMSIFLFADGSAKVMRSSIDPEIYRRLGSRNDGMPVSSSEF